MRVLMISSEWPGPSNPNGVPFVVRQVAFLRKYGIEVEVFHFRGSGNPINYFKAWKACQKVKKSFKPDLIHAQWGQSVLPGLPKNCPVVITYRGDDLEGVINSKGKHGLKSLILRNIGRYVSRYADRIIVVAPHLIEKFKSKVPVYIIPSGLDLSMMPIESKVEAKKKLGLPLDKRIVIFPNNPKDKRKNLALVQETLALLPEEDKNKVYFLQAYGMPHNELMLNMKAADFLIFTSLHEGSPNVVKEALANDVAVISVPVGDVRIRLENVPGCGVSDAYDAGQLASLLSKNMCFFPTAGELSEKVANLDENVLVNKVISIYKEAIAHYVRN